MADSLFSLVGKTALVTGGARGLGKMIAQGLSDAGARVYITSRNPEMLREAAALIGDACIPLPGDAGTPAGVKDIAAGFRAAGESQLHLLVNNAGRTWGAPIEIFPSKAWGGVMAVNVEAPFCMVQEMLAELKAGGSPEWPSRVINIGSVAGAATNDLNAYSYVASKAALHQLSRQLARDLAKHNINVNALLPGFFPTAMTSHLRDDAEAALFDDIPMSRLGRPDDIAGAVVFLGSRAGAYVTGAELVVDGGFLGCR